MTTTSRPPGNPTRPAIRPTRHDFAATLKELRKWSGLTLKDLEDRHNILKVSTSSDYLRGVRWPRWEWIDAFVTTCLTHRGVTDPVRIQAELAHWRTAWGHVEHHRTGQGQPPEAPRQAHSTEASTREPTGAVQPGTRDQEEDAEAPTRLRTVRSELVEAPHEQPPAAMTGGGDSDPTTRNAAMESVEKQLGQAAATPHGDPRPPNLASPGQRRPWVLGGAAAVIVAAGVLVATATGVLGNPAPAGSISPPPLVPGKTFLETVNSPLGARTYSKPHTLSGEWQRVPNKTNVQVSCEITAPSAPNVGLYWYRITSPPYNNQYYSPANSFLNGDPPDGSAPTHVVDQAVPECPH
jgi:hypothetical protein